MAGKFMRAGVLAPLALLTFAIAAALVIIASIILNKIIDNKLTGQGSGFNRVSPTLQWLEILACAFAFTAAWTAFWHTKTYRASTRYTSGSHSWLAFFITCIPAGLAFKAICIAGLDALNWVSIILTWSMWLCLLLLAFLLHTPLNNPEPEHYHHHRHHEHTVATPGTMEADKELSYNTSPAGAPGYNRNVDRVV
jgi:hypothetical protein